LNTLHVTPVAAFADNYIWLIRGINDPGSVVVVDPGDAHAVKRVLSQQRLALAGILITHHHADHTAGVVELINEWNVPVYGPAKELIPGNPTLVSGGTDIGFIQLGLTFSVIDVPGHTEGHIAYMGHNSLFCGDTLFSGGCGRLLGGTAPQLWHSLNRLAQLPHETRVYCTHEYTVGNLMFARTIEPDNSATAAYLENCRRLRAEDRPTLPTTIGIELNINPFLRVKNSTVKRSAEQHAGHPLDSDLDVFTTLREWKNHFRS
jgi:hydroxyacylglutathione hydrolase